ncbi:hypothetical protein PQQ99_28100 [Paraburkholderia sediminicola]|uniref:hypothetical protein n=1 Tax=Paraburkholderia sediminicola TaxID=458836 RepID=UPI0038BE012F
MKKIIFAALLACASSAYAHSYSYGQPSSSNTYGGSTGQHYVNSYSRSDGTEVQGHYQTNPNGTKADNWSTQGNQNPYTGQWGTKPAY